MTLYIDPGTGSMLFTILISILGAVIYALRNLWVKIKFMSAGGNFKNTDKSGTPFVIFTDSKRYWSIFKPICDEMEKRGQQLLYLTADANDPMLSEKYENIRAEFAGEGNKTYARMNMLKADIVLSSTPGLDVYQWKRSRDVKWYAHVLHAANDPILYRMFGMDYYDALLLSGEYQIKQVRDLEKIRNLPEKEIRLVGLPHLDALRARLLCTPPLDKHETTVLLASSWGSNGILSRYGSRIINKLLETNYHIVIRPHPQSFISDKEMLDELMNAYPENDRLEWDRSVDNFDVLHRSDIMISDFSGVIFDYTLVFGKPVISANTSFDNSPYDAWWLENAEWTFPALEKIGQKLTDNNIDSIQEIIDRCLNEDDIRERINKVRGETWVNIGHSVETIADYLIQKRAELKAYSDND